MAQSELVEGEGDNKHYEFRCVPDPEDPPYKFVYDESLAEEHQRSLVANIGEHPWFVLSYNGKRSLIESLDFRIPEKLVAWIDGRQMTGRMMNQNNFELVGTYGDKSMMIIGSLSEDRHRAEGQYFFNHKNAKNEFFDHSKGGK
jgi:hypothetical protein